MREMTQEEVKQVGYEILTVIDDLCRKHEITYYLAYGTLLGAVRHKDFIPWDDDVDIGVSVSEYERFLQVLHEESQYQVLSFIARYQEFPSCFSKISDPRTAVIDNEETLAKIPRGVAVDISLFMTVMPVKRDAEKQDSCLQQSNVRFYAERTHTGTL